MTLHTHDHFDHTVETRSVNWREWAKALLLVGIGLDLALLIATNTITYYISPHFAWLTHIAAGLLIFFGALTVFDLLRGGAHHEHHDHEHHDHHHEELTWTILAVIAIPLVLGLLFPAKPLSADSVNGGISMSSVGVSSEDIEAIPPTERNIIQWLRLFEASEDVTSFNDQSVRVIGFVYDEPGFGADHAMVVRFTISCCVADALAIGLPIRTAGADLPALGTWIQVTGTLQTGMFDGNEIPVIIPQTIEPIEMPDDPYLYS